MEGIRDARASSTSYLPGPTIDSREVDAFAGGKYSVDSPGPQLRGLRSKTTPHDHAASQPGG
jgi:hypothetical protein